jgi:hydrogenase large subunit
MTIALPQYGKTGAYSWIKAPRCNGLPHEVGPLARMWAGGDYRNGIAVLNRLEARALETLKIAQIRAAPALSGVRAVGS